MKFLFRTKIRLYFPLCCQNSRPPRVCHFLKHIETKISLFCKVFLAFFMLLLYNIFVGTTVFSRRVSCLLKPFRIMGKNI